MSAKVIFYLKTNKGNLSWRTVRFFSDFQGGAREKATKFLL